MMFQSKMNAFLALILLFGGNAGVLAKSLKECQDNEPGHFWESLDGTAKRILTDKSADDGLKAEATKWQELRVWDKVHSAGVMAGEMKPEDFVCAQDDKKELDNLKKIEEKNASWSLSQGFLFPAQNGYVGDINLLTEAAREKVYERGYSFYPQDSIPQAIGDQDRAKILHLAAQDDRSELYQGIKAVEEEVFDQDKWANVKKVVKKAQSAESLRVLTNGKYARLHNAFLVCRAAGKNGDALTEQETVDCKKIAQEMYALNKDEAVKKYGKDYQFSMPEFEKFIKAEIARRASNLPVQDVK